MSAIDEFEQKLEEALAYAEARDIAGNYAVLLSTFTRKLHERGIRVVLVALGEPIGAYPHVEVTAEVDDVTASAVTQVVDPILRKVGVPDPMVMMFAGTAGTATVKFLDKLRHRPTPPSQPFKPRWDPRRRPQPPRR